MEHAVRMKIVPDKFIKSSAGDHCLYIFDTREQKILPVPVKLGEHVVEKQDRPVLYLLLQLIKLDLI